MRIESHSQRKLWPGTSALHASAMLEYLSHWKYSVLSWFETTFSGRILNLLFNPDFRVIIVFSTSKIANRTFSLFPVSIDKYRLSKNEHRRSLFLGRHRAENEWPIGQRMS